MFLTAYMAARLLIYSAYSAKARRSGNVQLSHQERGFRAVLKNGDIFIDTDYRYTAFYGYTLLFLSNLTHK